MIAVITDLNSHIFDGEGVRGFTLYADGSTGPKPRLDPIGTPFRLFDDQHNLYASGVMHPDKAQDVLDWAAERWGCTHLELSCASYPSSSVL